MKKLLILTLTAIMLLTSGVALAARDATIDGDIKLHYRWNDGIYGDTEGGKTWIRINAKTALSDKVDAYARVSSQHLTGDLTGADFDQSYSKYDMDGLTVLDRFGILVKNNGYQYNIGRQGLTLGATALMYSTDCYTGKNMGAIDGVVVTGKAGKTDLKFAAGKQWGEDYLDAKVYAIEASYKPAKDFTVGAVLGRVDYDGGNTNHWGVNIGYELGKANFAAEYAKSNVDDLNSAYALGVNYAFDKKHSVYVYYSKVEVFGDMAGLTDFDNNGKGVYYGYDYQIRPDVTFSLFYKDMKVAAGIDQGEKYDSFRTTVTYKF